MRKIKAIFFISFLWLFLFNSVVESSTDLDRYKFAKKNYITAIFKNDKEKEEKYLKDLILYGKKSNQDISKYQTELYRISSKIKKASSNKTKNSISQKKYEDRKNENILDDIPDGLLKDKETFVKGDIDYDIRSISVKDDSIIVDFSKKISANDIKFSKRKEKNGYLYTFDIKGNFRDTETTTLTQDGIDKVDISQETDTLFHLSILNENDPKIYYMLLDKRLIIKNTIENRSPKQENKTIAIANNDLKEILPPMNNSKNNRVKTIVIDAGHGGKDSGAVGPNNEHEKVVTLKIAKYLYNSLKSLGYVVYLTRDDDTYIALKERTNIANRKNADLFVSIHANAVTKDKVMYAKGIETYFLSPARSERAKGVAALENKEDMDAMDNFSDQDLVLTLLNRGKTVQSQKMAIDVQSHILYQLRKKYGNLIIDNGVREAPFWVLVGAQMPAVLVEVGYISHPEESQLIMSDTYQQEMANGIAEGVTAYFIHNR
ncbi:MAG: N-acetylmuramoyl-L-alanine amidase [Arcobacteraceae bacterium]|nr:N-acetylmuramoyl-L-alanine amidase [Arcobacteraceae bacterium]